ncbi:MAG: OmpA family protein [Thiohalobacteraceae bacterium]|nr:OmpA family protein [Gammaproteobacteria bacterium]
MKTTNNNRTLYTTLLTTLFTAGLALATPAAADSHQGYAANSGNTIWRSAFGECWHTSSWTKDKAIAECEPHLIAKVEEPAPVAVAPEPRRTVVRISLESDTYFGFDKAELTDSGKAKLDEMAAELAGKKDPRIQITGYTDRIGSEAYNMGLSQRRADAVKTYLAGKGIQTDIMETAAMGPKNPVVNCEGMTGRALIECLGPNRRTEVEFSAFEVVEETQ